MKLSVELGDRSYDITIDRGGLKRAGEIFRLDRRVLVVTDSGVPSQYAKAVADACRDAVVATIPEGEESKQFPIYESLLGTMLEHGFKRGDCAVAVGGGVCGDLTGFAAATYMRGIDFYNVPTTVLSQVDSSIGGKTAIDFHGIKNVIGAFWQPKGVLIDPVTLQTLSPRQTANGLAEAVKMALTSDAELFRIFEEEDVTSRMETVIERSLRIKKAVVEADEREGGLRKILNFGHTLGHAIESSEAPRLLHGECVALGMLPMCSDPVRERLLPVLQKLGLPTETDTDPGKILDAMGHDKKGSAKGIDAVLTDKIGSCRIETLTLEDLIARFSRVFGGRP